MARPTEYQRWKKAGVLKNKLGLLYGMAANGHSDVKIAEALNIKDATLRKMIKDEPDVDDAYHSGKYAIGGFVTNIRKEMLADKNVKDEIRHQISVEMEKQFNGNIIAEAPKEGFDERGVPTVINNLIASEYANVDSKQLETGEQLMARMKEAESNE